MTDYTSSLMGPPTSAYVAPGSCQITEKAAPLPLLKATKVSETTSVFRFATPDTSKPLNLPTCACILTKTEIGGENVVRPYTPISTNKDVGYFDLLVKNYGEGAKMSKHMHDMKEGDESVSFFHIAPNVKLQAPTFSEYDEILMIIGGTGVTPMIQALHEMLGDESIKTKVTVLYGSRVSTDILGAEMLNAWAKSHSDQLTVIHVLSAEPEDSSWDGLRGFVSKDLIEKNFPAANTPGKKLGVWVCGPPPMYAALSGPRDEKDKITGALGELGYTPEQVYKY